MNSTLISTLIWISAGGVLFMFMRRRRNRRAQR